MTIVLRYRVFNATTLLRRNHQESTGQGALNGLGHSGHIYEVQPRTHWLVAGSFLKSPALPPPTNYLWLCWNMSGSCLYDGIVFLIYRARLHQCTYLSSCPRPLKGYPRLYGCYSEEFEDESQLLTLVPSHDGVCTIQFEDCFPFWLRVNPYIRYIASHISFECAYDVRGTQCQPENDLYLDFIHPVRLGLMLA